MIIIRYSLTAHPNNYSDLKPFYLSNSSAEIHKLKKKSDHLNSWRVIC
jgi:hypothetical protein